MDLTNRWLSMLGIGTIVFGFSLFVLHIPVRTIIIFFVIGVSVIGLWLYADARSKRQKRIDAITTEGCICSICKHDEAKICLQQKCACCLMMKGDTVIG